MTPDEARQRAVEAAGKATAARQYPHGKWEEMPDGYRAECLDDAACAIAAYEAALWQPIETAPRDGTKIDLWFAGAWNERMPGFVWRPGVDFWHNDSTHQSYNDDPNIITHWRPLPAGPGGE